jgi:hypothetical protein
MPEGWVDWDEEWGVPPEEHEEDNTES